MKNDLLIKIILIINTIIIIIALVAIQSANYDQNDDPGYIDSKKLYDQKIIVSQFDASTDMTINMVISDESKLKLYGYKIRTFDPSAENYKDIIHYPLKIKKGDLVQIIGNFDVQEVEYNYRHGGKEYHFYRLEIIRWLNKVDHQLNQESSNTVSGPLSNKVYDIQSSFVPSEAELLYD